MTKIKFSVSKNKLTFSKGQGKFSLYRETTEDDLKRYFELVNQTNIISHFNQTEDGWEFFNTDGKRAYCTHADLIEKLEQLQRKT